MLVKLRERLQRGEEGFTLIELMVVVLIIAILIAIAIPTFLGARKRAQDKQAQSNIRNGLTAEKTYYVDVQAYTETPANLTPIESSLDYTGTDASVRQVQPVLAGAQAASDNQAVCLQSKSKSGTMFAIVDVASGSNAGTWYGKSTTGAAVCAASGTLFAAGTTWFKDASQGW